MYFCVFGFSILLKLFILCNTFRELCDASENTGVGKVDIYQSIRFEMKFKVTGNRNIFLLTFYLVYVLWFNEAFGIETSQRTCITSAGTAGTCVRLSECQSMPFFGLGTILSSICAVSDSFAVCCPRQKSNNDSSEQRPESQDTSNVNWKVSSRYKPLRPPHCGLSKTIHNRVVGGDLAELDAWPWMAAIAIRYGDQFENFEFICGGSLISSRYVVTAAHCMNFEDTPYFARLGEQDLNSTDDGARPIDFAVEKITIHPNFVEATKENDIAILRLDRDVEFSSSIHPICLPVVDAVRNRNFVRSYQFVAGWGATSYRGPSSSILRETEVPVVDEAQCQKSYKNEIAKKNIVIDDRVICAGYAKGGKDTCQGDSGGPLMFSYKMSFYLIGIVSNGYRCAVAGYPGIYTRVTYFLEYILANMQ